MPFRAACSAALLLFALALLPAPARPRETAEAPVVYRVSHLDPAAHSRQVECTPPFSGELTFGMPRWVPGSYYRLPLRRYVTDVQLSGREGRPIALREDPSRWRWQATIPAGEPVTLSYAVHAAEGDGNRG